MPTPREERVKASQTINTVRNAIRKDGELLSAVLRSMSNAQLQETADLLFETFIMNDELGVVEHETAMAFERLMNRSR